MNKLIAFWEKNSLTGKIILVCVIINVISLAIKF